MLARALTTASFLLIPALVGAAPLGPSFTYQGELTQSGTPVDGTVHLRFSLWDAPGTGVPPTGGTQIGASQVAANVPIQKGIFTALVNPGGEFGANAFNGDARWLQVEVCTDGTCSSATVLGPRQALTGAPYALGPWQMSGSNLSYVGGNVGIGTASPSSELHIQSSSPAIFLEDTATPSNQSGYLSFRSSVAGETGWVGYGSAGSPLMSVLNFRPGGDIDLHTATGTALIAKSDGKVGIGTSTPTERLEVRGNIRLGSSGEYFAPAGAENLRVIRGEVSSAGAQVRGTGFTCSRTGTGTYQINFSPAFPTIGGEPDITVSPESSTVFFVGIVKVALYNSATIRIVNASNTAVDATFHFIAVGPR